jgi:hypothetical protein
VGRPKKDSPKPTHLGFRGSAELTARLDRIAEAMGKRLGGVEVPRSQVLKAMVERALLTMEPEFTGKYGTLTQTEIRDVLTGEIGRVTNIRDAFPARLKATARQLDTEEPDNDT